MFKVEKKSDEEDANMYVGGWQLVINGRKKQRGYPTKSSRTYPKKKNTTAGGTTTRPFYTSTGYKYTPTADNSTLTWNKKNDEKKKKNGGEPFSSRTYQEAKEKKLMENETVEKDYFNKEFIARVIKFRMDKGWTQEELAKNVMVKVDLIASFEKGTLQYDPTLVQKFNKLLKNQKTPVTAIPNSS
jgi:DNA-binding XRE family transcriptional regulator